MNQGLITQLFQEHLKDGLIKTIDVIASNFNGGHLLILILIGWFLTRFFKTLDKILDDRISSWLKQPGHFTLSLLYFLPPVLFVVDGKLYAAGVVAFTAIFYLIICKQPRFRFNKILVVVQLFLCILAYLGNMKLNNYRFEQRNDEYDVAFLLPAEGYNMELSATALLHFD